MEHAFRDVVHCKKAINQSINQSMCQCSQLNVTQTFSKVVSTCPCRYSQRARARARVCVCVRSVCCLSICLPVCQANALYAPQNNPHKHTQTKIHTHACACALPSSTHPSTHPLTHAPSCVSLPHTPPTHTHTCRS